MREKKLLRMRLLRYSKIIFALAIVIILSGLIAIHIAQRPFQKKQAITIDLVEKYAKFHDISNFSENNLVAYIIDAKNIDIKCEKIAVIINANNKDVDVELEESNWHVMVDEKTAGNEIIETIKDSKVNVSRKSIKVLIK